MSEGVPGDSRPIDQVLETERRFRELVDNLDTVFWIQDLQAGRMDYISPAYERLWGRTTESLYANPLSFLESIHPDDVRSGPTVPGGAAGQPPHPDRIPGGPPRREHPLGAGPRVPDLRRDRPRPPHRRCGHRHLGLEGSGRAQPPPGRGEPGAGWPAGRVHHLRPPDRAGRAGAGRPVHRRRHGGGQAPAGQHPRPPRPGIPRRMGATIASRPARGAPSADAGDGPAPHDPRAREQ